MFDVTLHQSLFDTSHSLNFILKIYGLGTQVKESFLLIILADSSSSLISLFFFLNKSHIYSFIHSWFHLGYIFLSFLLYLFFIFHFFLYFFGGKKRLIFMWQVEMGLGGVGMRRTFKKHLKNWNFFIYFFCVISLSLTFVVLLLAGMVKLYFFGGTRCGLKVWFE